MVETQEILNKQILAQRRKFLEDLIKRRYVYSAGFDIYGGVAGFYDYGPVGCAIKNNVEQLWREHFILEDDMLEINTTCLVPEVVLKNSGHVEKFTDLIVKDTKTGQGYRADKLLEEWIDKKLQKEEAKMPEQQKKDLLVIQAKADTYTKEEMKNIFQQLQIVSNEKNPLTDPEPFNLMFGTQIGPTGSSQGYLRPETAQGIFVNFGKLLEFNNCKMPFAAATIGLGFRNEIAPRQGLIRVREFQMAEIEHFVDPLDKFHPKFCYYANLKLNLFARLQQEQMVAPINTMTLEQAVNDKIINNQTLAYFMARTFLFLVQVGVNPNNVRFRQHRANEMAHYAQDCWDAEIETSQGWIECVGIADRACYDLDRHSKGSKIKLLASRKFKEPQLRKITQLKFNRQLIGKEFKKQSTILVNYLEGLSDDEVAQLKVYYDQHQEKTFVLEDVEFKCNNEMIKFEMIEKIVQEEKFQPSVIEPSFGIGRILNAVFEHCFKMRDEKRTYLSLPVRVAPVKCSILTVITAPEYKPYIDQIKKQLTKVAISSKVDDSGVSIGKKYARTDEIGIPLAITIDKQTLDDKTVTLRELNTMKQVRISLDEIIKVMSELNEGFIVWSDVLNKYPLFETKGVDNENA